MRIFLAYMFSCWTLACLFYAVYEITATYSGWLDSIGFVMLAFIPAIVIKAHKIYMHWAVNKFYEPNS